MNPISTEAVVRCEWCDGCGVISYNPNLNPNEFFGHAVVKCVRCNGTGIDLTQLDDSNIRVDNS